MEPEEYVENIIQRRNRNTKRESGRKAPTVSKRVKFSKLWTVLQAVSCINESSPRKSL
jgi:hypothetical protein